MANLHDLAAALGWGVALRGLRRAHSRRKIEALRAALVLPGSDWRPASFTDLRTVPAPVRRYLESVLPAGTSAPAMMVSSQHGELRTSATSKRWMSFAAIHHATVTKPGFVWDARVAATRWLPLTVLDSLIDGQGSGQVLLLSALTLAHDAGTMEMNSGSMHRFLAEAVWYPWALLPSNWLHWAPIAVDRAMATMTANGLTVALEFRFTGTGEVAAVYSPGRWGSFDGHYVQVAWEGHFSEYERQAGVFVPRRGEVGWYHDGRLELVWRGGVDHISWE